MSLGNQQRGGAQFLKIKAGKFYLSTDKEEQNPYTQLDGHLTDIYHKTETFNNKPLEKTYFVITSEDGAYQFNLMKGSQQWALFTSFLKNTSPREPMTIQAREGEVTSNGNVSTNLFISQNGVPMKAFYKKDNGNQLPQWVKHEVAGKVIWDKRDWENALLADLEEVKAKISSNKPPSSNITPNTPQQPTLNPQGFPPPDDKFDDLPF